MTTEDHTLRVYHSNRPLVRAVKLSEVGSLIINLNPESKRKEGSKDVGAERRENYHIN